MIHIVKIMIHTMILFVFYHLGMWIQTTFKLAIPGSVIGLIILFLCLLCNVIKVEWVEDGASFLMKHLVIFFIPSTVSLIGYHTLFAGKGSLLIVITIISTILVMIVSGLVTEFLVRRAAND